MPAPLTQAAEDYLKAIYKLQLGTETVSTNELAAAMNVTAASATNMVKRLAKMELVVHRSYHGVALTRAGEQVALEIIRHHRLLELYLREVMGYDWEALHSEAEHLEHHISEDFENRIDALLGYPTHDPHGDPIPTRSGEMPEVSRTALADVAAGRARRIERISDHDPALLRHLEAAGLLPGADVVVVRREADGGLWVHTEHEIHLPADAAAHVFVTETADDAVSR